MANDNCVIESEAFTKLKIYSNLCLILEYESIPTSAAFNSSACVLYTLILWCDPQTSYDLSAKSIGMCCHCFLHASPVWHRFPPTAFANLLKRPLLFVFVVQGRVPFWLHSGSFYGFKREPSTTRENNFLQIPFLLVVFLLHVRQELLLHLTLSEFEQHHTFPIEDLNT